MSKAREHEAPLDQPSWEASRPTWLTTLLEESENQEESEQLDKLYSELSVKIIGRTHPPKEVLEAFFAYCARSPAENSTRAKAGLDYVAEAKKQEQGNEARLRAAMPTHMRRSGYSIRLLQRLRDLIKWPDTELDTDWTLGVPLVGPIRRSGYFQSNKVAGADYDEQELRLKIEEWKRGEAKTRERPPDWMPKHNRERLECEVEKLGRDIELKEYPPGYTAPKTYAFGVEQGKWKENKLIDGELTPIYEKLRLILDWKKTNQLSPQSEKVELYSHTVVQQLIQLATAGEVRLPQTQMKKDIAKQVGQTIKGVTTPQQVIRDHAVRNPKLAGKEIRRFVPYFVKIDFEKYFFQNLVDSPMLNNITYWVESLRSYRERYSDASQFGNIHSLWTGVRLSRLLQEIVSKILGYPCIIYIDDTIIIVYCGEHAREAETMVSQLYIMLGIRLSATKICKLDEPNDSIEILGLLYQRSHTKIVVTLPPEKVAKIETLIEEALSATANRNIAFKQVERLAGKLIYYLFASGSQLMGGLVSYVLAWSCEDYYKKHQQSHKAVELFNRVLEILLEKIREGAIKPIEFEKKKLKRALMYTDASYARNRGNIGGLIEIRNPETKEVEVRRSFSFKHQKKYFKKVFGIKDHIGLYELLAAAVGPLVLKKGAQKKGVELLQMIDNIPSIFWLVKKTMNLRNDEAREKLAFLLSLAEKLEDLITNIAYDYIKTGDNPGDWYTRDAYIEKTKICKQQAKPKVVKTILKQLEQNFYKFLSKLKKQDGTTSRCEGTSKTTAGAAEAA